MTCASQVVTAERDDLISIRNPCYNVIVESRESSCMTLRVDHDLQPGTNPNYIPLPNLGNH